MHVVGRWDGIGRASLRVNRNSRNCPDFCRGHAAGRHGHQDLRDTVRRCWPCEPRRSARRSACDQVGQRRHRICEAAPTAAPRGYYPVRSVAVPEHMVRATARDRCSLCIRRGIIKRFIRPFIARATCWYGEERRRHGPIDESVNTTCLTVKVLDVVPCGGVSEGKRVTGAFQERTPDDID